MKVSVLIGSRDRFEILLRCLQSALAQDYAPLEILVLDDNSSRYQLSDLIKDALPNSRISCFRTDKSLGVAGGRNFLMQQANGEIFCFIDDDAYFADNCCIAQLVDAFNANPKTAIVATKVIDHYNGRMNPAVPFSQQWRRKTPELLLNPQRVSYYVGTCHAIHRQVIEQCGNYQQDLMFGEEELDLSYRVVEQGMEILYWPSVVIHHYPQPSVVTSQGKYHNSELYYHIRNRFILAYKYLPAIYIPVYLGIWLSRYGFDALKDASLHQFLSGVISGITILKNLKRTPLTSPALQYIKTHYGRLWY